MSSPATEPKPLENLPERAKIDTLKISGFRGIKHAQIELRDINVLIGANGTGKSNILSAFGLLERIADASFDRAISEMGGSNFVLYGGNKVTNSAKIKMVFESNKQKNEQSYQLELLYSDENKPILKETIKIPNSTSSHFFTHDSTFLNENNLRLRIGKNYNQEIVKYAAKMQTFLSQARVHHFTDSSKQARFRQSCLINDNRYLKFDAGNLAAWLYRFSKTQVKQFEFFENLMRRVIPGFDRFALSPDPLNETLIRLEYRDTRHDLLLTASYFSDGSIRFIALAALLLFNPPPIILIDEPELGLHPTALQLVADLIRQASFESQIIVATQSADFLNQFEPDQILVVEREENSEETLVKRLDATELAGWLEDYSIGDLWLKNVLGGKP